MAMAASINVLQSGVPEQLAHVVDVQAEHASGELRVSSSLAWRFSASQEASGAKFSKSGFQMGSPRLFRS
jgi:hypothetical protein